MRAMVLASMILGAAVLAACDGGDGDPGGRDSGPSGRVDSGPGGGVDTGPGGGEDAGPPSEWPMTLEASIGPITVSPSDENTVCVTVELPNEVEVMATEVRAFIGDGSHHLIVYRATAAGTPEPTPCSPFI